MFIALSIIALVLTCGLSAYVVSLRLSDIISLLSGILTEYENANQLNADMIDMQRAIHLDYVQWRTEDMERQQQQDALRQSEHDAFVKNQKTQQEGASSIAQSMHVLAMLTQMQQPKRSHHRKAVQEQEQGQATEQLPTSEIVQESE